MINKHIIIARGGEQRSKLESYFQAIGAKTVSFPILKVTELQLTDDDLKKMMKGHRLIFLNPTSMDIFFRQMAEKQHSFKHPIQIEYVSGKSRKLLEQMGIPCMPARYGKASAILLGHDQQKRNHYSDDDQLLITHKLAVDEQYLQEMRILLKKDSWNTVVFPNKLAVDFFIKYWHVLKLGDFNKISFAAVGNMVKAYAMEQGFSELDENIQALLHTDEWKSSM
ncbi:hypothetical protein [Niallia taxi]|uniref:Uroporphyrinogen-III synthase n=1 Tax=Niallia taxi TaxID=2499688 RepID=A0A3S2WZV1_9BACI|nr:hypothetical protein [Niallia taxi]RVT58013.1 hypothetical protein EM808_23490 [Niallia taxi]